MPASVTIQQLVHSTSDNRPLFSGLNVSFGKERTGLIGRNGTGKSTLLSIIAGLTPPASGSVTVEGSLAMLHQSVQVEPDRTVADHLGIAGALAILERLERGTGTADDAAEADWTLPGRIDAAVTEMGLPALELNRPLNTLSGGQRTRLSLAGLILKRPEIILLDEPTNNLDLDGRSSVIELLRRWRGSAIVVSHDRVLLREMDTIVELTKLGAATYGGNWDRYSERKALEMAAAQHELSVAERRISEIDRKVQAVAERKARKDSAGRRKAAKDDLPRILLGGMKENAENSGAANARLANKLRGIVAAAANQARGKIEVLVPFSATLAPTGLPAGRTVIQADNLTGGPIGTAPVIRSLSFSLVGPERVAVVGPNGSGKTTLLRLLTGEMAALSGDARINVPYALLDQTVSILDPELSVRDNFRILNQDTDDITCRATLARFMFRADAALQRIATLSGGEMLRAGLACTIGGNNPPQLLILDEPTNHLDIQAIEQVEAGLRGYDGAILVISHDADFLTGIGINRKIVLPGELAS